MQSNSDFLKSVEGLSGVVNLLDAVSLWITASVTPDDVEHERQQLEAKYQEKIAVHEISHRVINGRCCTRIEWKIV